MSSSLDFLNEREENCLKSLTCSSVSVGVFPVFVASTARESESLGRAIATNSSSILTPTELNHSMQSATCTIPRSFHLLTVPGGAVSKCPFRATALWENTVFHLENSVKPGRHSSGLRIYENCFRGAQAVDCLSTYLNAVLPKTVSQGQVLILCHKLVLTGVMEDVKDKERTMFKAGRLYRFSKEHFWQQPAYAAESSSSPTPTLLGCLSPTLQSTPTDRHKIENNVNRAALAVSSIKYPSDSTIAVSSRTKHHLSHRRSSYEPHSEFKQRTTKTGETLQKVKRLLLRWHAKKLRSDPPECSDRGNVKLSRRNAMRRESRPLIWARVRDQQTFTIGKDKQRLYREMAPTQRSQSQSCKVKKDGTCIASCCKFRDRVYGQTEMEAVDGIKMNRSKVRKSTAKSKENNHAVKSYYINTDLQGHTNELKINACVSPVSSVREDALTAAPAPAGMNWVVYGYL